MEGVRKDDLPEPGRQATGYQGSCNGLPNNPVVLFYLAVPLGIIACRSAGGDSLAREEFL